MTNEEMERAIEFVIKQQAQFATDLQNLSSELQKATESHLRTEQNLGTTVELVGQIAQNQLQMTEVQIRLDKALTETNEALKETNERLNSLIIVVERYFSNGQGKA